MICDLRGMANVGLEVGVLSGPAGQRSGCARDILVNNTAGDDRFSGLRWETSSDGAGPLHSIGRALQLAQVGDCVVLAKTARPYREAISLVGSRHSGTPRQPFVLRGNGAILDGSEPIPPDAWQSYEGPVFRFRPRAMGHQPVVPPRPAVAQRAGPGHGGAAAEAPSAGVLLPGRLALLSRGAG